MIIISNNNDDNNNKVELEHSTGEPNIIEIQQRAHNLLHSFDANKSRDLDFLEFSKLLFRHPKLFGTAVMLRSYFIR